MLVYQRIRSGIFCELFFSMFFLFHMFWGVSRIGCEHDLISTNPASKPQDASRCLKDLRTNLAPRWPLVNRLQGVAAVPRQAPLRCSEIWETHHLRCKFTSNSSPCDTVNQVVPTLYIYIISYHIISYHIISYHIISYHYIPFKVSNFSRWFPDFHFKASKFSRCFPDFQIFWAFFWWNFRSPTFTVDALLRTRRPGA